MGWRLSRSRSWRLSEARDQGRCPGLWVWKRHSFMWGLLWHAGHDPGAETLLRGALGRRCRSGCRATRSRLNRRSVLHTARRCWLLRFGCGTSTRRPPVTVAKAIALPREVPHNLLHLFVQHGSPCLHRKLQERPSDHGKHAQALPIFGEASWWVGSPLAPKVDVEHDPTTDSAAADEGHSQLSFLTNPILDILIDLQDRLTEQVLLLPAAREKLDEQLAPCGQVVKDDGALRAEVLVLVLPPTILLFHCPEGLDFGFVDS
mmetsp:Transcript_64505/g.151562  ORF Transcript_64505/g.151562 Transcript_64505/m.151562 type:complete len:261 (+) Transcript_64505:989-1771(+)